MIKRVSNKTYKKKSLIFRSRGFRFFIFSLLPIFIGTIGHMLIEGWNFEDSLYMTVTTLTTIGYGEVHPLSSQGRWFNMALIFLGVGTLALAISQLAQEVLENGLRNIFGGKSMKSKMAKLSDHIILCGMGQMGRQVAGALKKNDVSFVVIEKDEKCEPSLRELGVPYLIGLAESDELLKDAGIERARGLITAVTSDAENVFITLTARSLNKNLTIVARAFDETSTPKLLRAGASKVVSPYTHAGLKMATAILNPGTDSFLETAANIDLLEIQMVDIEAQKDSPLIGLTLEEAQNKLKARNLMIVGIKKAQGRINLAPKYKGAIEIYDRLIVLGDEEFIN